MGRSTKTAMFAVLATMVLLCAPPDRWLHAQPPAPGAAAATDDGTRFEHNVMIPMRDGVQLAANIFRPAAEGAYPVILMRTPYGKPGEGFGDGARYPAAGYVLVVQDCRGRGDSEGQWDPFRHEPQDGFDTQQWIGAQPWCNGQIGTAGGSYVGWTQWASAPGSSRYLKTMVPVVPFGDVYHDIAYPGGALQLSLLIGWGAAVGGIQAGPERLEQAFRFLPLNRWNSQFDHEVPYLADWIAHPSYDEYWKQRRMQDRYAEVTVPVLNVGGWYDIFSKTTIELVDQVRSSSKDHAARRNQLVVIGPWGHGVGGRKLGELDFGQQAARDVGQLQFRWFEYWLKDRDTGIEDWPAYQLFVMGENRWRGEQQWPLARTEFTPFYLHSEGGANSRAGDGVLSKVSPGDQPPDEFSYDPDNPVPTHGGNNLVLVPAGPYDQSEIEDRRDVLVYTTPPLAERLEVTGPVKMILYATSSARDTDFTAKLVDVHPDGKAYNLCDGIQRARYRNSASEPELIEPGETYRYEIDMWVTSNVFLPGHAIRLEVSSSNFPRFDRNPNTGNPFGTDTAVQTAEQTILHDAEHPSHLLLPVIPR